MASPTAVPHTIASTCPPTAPVTRPCAKWLSGSAASSATSTTDTYRTMVTASRKISARASCRVVIVRSLGEVTWESCVAPAGTCPARVANSLEVPQHRMRRVGLLEAVHLVVGELELLGGERVREVAEFRRSDD